MKDTTNRQKRTARLRDVKLEQMRINPLAQRELVPSWVDRILAEFEPEKMQPPHVNERDGHFWVIDGQHSIEALKLWLGDWKGQVIQCWTYQGLTSEQESDMFLDLNNKKPVAPLPKFKAAVHAGREVECEIDRVVRAQGCVISAQKVPGGIGAVGTVTRVFRRSSSAVLARTVMIIRDSYGDAGFESPVIDGVGLLCQRYNGELDDSVAVLKLSNAHGGVKGLLNKASQIRQASGVTMSEGVAMAAVDIINSGRGSKKLPKWRGGAS